MNDCGVFTVNRMDFEAHEKKRAFPNVEIHCAMEYPRVYVSFSLMGMSAGGGSYPNRDDMNFDVHEHPANVMLMIEHALAPKVGNDKKMQKLMREAMDKMEKCAECGKKWRWLYGDICGVCYEKNRKKADEIARGFKAEGWKEVPDNERENATYSLGGCIDERDMPAMEPRVGTRYFLIDVRHLTWRFFFRKGA
jgi:hypothetical protein